jgi:DNA-binding XRE family transcriptional regulator
MTGKERARLEAAGFRFGDAEDFLGLTDEERCLVEIRIAVSRAVRSRREMIGITQKQLATKMKSSQSRVAKIEAGAADVSLDLSIRALLVTGGGLQDLVKAFELVTSKKYRAIPRSHVKTRLGADR